MTVDNRTAQRAYPLPNLANQQTDDIPRIIAAFEAIGVDVQALVEAVATKAGLSHTHAMAAITGLVDALAGKAALGHQHALGDLTDVSAAGAANGQVIKRVGTQWQAASVLLGDVAGWEATVDAKVAAAIAAITGAAPAALDTLVELAAALGGDPTFAATITTALGNRLRVDAAQALTAGQLTQALDNLGLTAALAARVRADAAQAFTSGQQAQARANIGALATSDTSIVRHLAGGAITNAASQAIPLASYLTAGYRRFRLSLYKMTPDWDGVDLLLEASVNGGTSWLTSGYRYQHVFALGETGGGWSSDVAGALTTAFPLAWGHSSELGRGMSGVIDFEAGGARQLTFVSTLFAWVSGSGLLAVTMGGDTVSTAVNALRLRASSGNLRTLTWSLYGVE